MVDPWNNIDTAELYNQIYREEMTRTHEFNLMLVGLTGVGKSTLVKSLFKGSVKPEEPIGEPALNYYEDLIEENGVKLRLRCLETSNFDSHNSDVYKDYIDDKFKKYFVDKIRLPSWNIQDNLIHCCLYMIPPYGKMRLREEDLECMRTLHERVNLVPIIAKADTFNCSQLTKFKENIQADLKANGIKYFKFAFDEKEDEERAKVVKSEADRFPFAVVAADEPIVENKRQRWIRTTISGQIDITDKRYDFDALAKLLIRHCILNLIDTTHVKHYAKFKSELLETLHDDGRNLLSIGLEPFEVARIRSDMLDGSDRMRDLDAIRAEMDEELHKLQDKLQALKLKASAARSEKPMTPRNKPAILRERPNIITCFRGDTN